MHANKSVNLHQFAMVPRADIPRSSFQMQKTYKTTFDSGFLVPFYLQEVLPGDSFSLKCTLFARLATPIFPVMDNLYLETFFFFVPNRLLWNNWQKFMGEQRNPGDSTSFLIPVIESKAGGYDVGSVFDYLGLMTASAQLGARTFFHSALPLRAYAQIYNEWFRDENLAISLPDNRGDGPDLYTDYSLVRRFKRHDYFTGCLPFTQKGTAVSLPLGTLAPVRTNTADVIDGAQPALMMRNVSGADAPVLGALGVTNTAGLNKVGFGATGTGAITTLGYPSNLYADLSTATAATINQLRQAFQIQKLLERDARGGTRYTEILRAHFGVVSPDARLQRPEYLGGGSTPIQINPIAQTSASAVTGSTTPIATLSAFGQALAHGHGFSQSFVEHGYIIGIVNVRADLTYQQGLARMWSRRTRYDFYFPVFADLGEQAVLNKEIYVTGDLPTDGGVFGYQERWAEYRYDASQITGLFRSTAANTLDAWHYSQKFTALPTLNSTFMAENPPLGRNLAVQSAPYASQFYLDAFFDTRAARAMPLYSVPGLVDHF